MPEPSTDHADTTATADALDSVLGELGTSAAGLIVHVYRVGVGGKRAFVHEYDAADFTLPNVQRELGPGVYFAQVKSAGRIIKSAGFNIDAPIGGIVRQEPAPKAAAPAAEAGLGMRDILGLMQQQSQQTHALILAMIQQPRAAPDNGIKDILPLLLPIVKDRGGGGMLEAIEGLRALHETAGEIIPAKHDREHRGGASTEETLLSMLAPIIGKMLQQGPPPPKAGPAPAAVHAAAAAPLPQLPPRAPVAPPSPAAPAAGTPTAASTPADSRPAAAPPSEPSTSAPPEPAPSAARGADAAITDMLRCLKWSSRAGHAAAATAGYIAEMFNELDDEIPEDQPGPWDLFEATEPEALVTGIIAQAPELAPKRRWLENVERSLRRIAADPEAEAVADPRPPLRIADNGDPRPG